MPRHAAHRTPRTVACHTSGLVLALFEPVVKGDRRPYAPRERRAFGEPGARSRGGRCGDEAPASSRWPFSSAWLIERLSSTAGADLPPAVAAEMG
jgi:hypothetical protein